MDSPIPFENSLRHIDDAEQLSALSEPHRFAILRRLMAGQATISQLGQAFGRHPAWIRHHVLRLLAVGLAELAETRKVRNYTEKYYRATASAFSLHALILPDTGGPRPLIALGSHDVALEMLASDDDAREASLVSVAVGSLDGLVALRQGLADIAGCHLLDPLTGKYNTPTVQHLFPDRDIAMVTLAEREQGLIVAPGNPKNVRGIDDLGRDDLRLVNRNRGSGTRLWLDSQLRSRGIPRDAIAGYEEEVSTHAAAARAVASGHADVGLGIRAAAERSGAAFIPLFVERYDLVIAEEKFAEEPIQTLLHRLDSTPFRKSLRRLGGYETALTGREEHVSA